MQANLDPQSKLKVDLKRGFKAINSTGNFAAWDALPTTPPATFLLDGDEVINMPLSHECIQSLIAKADQPSYGSGDKALIDAPVPGVWEIRATQLFFIEPAWQAYLVELSKNVAPKLGFSGPIRLDFQKMLIYATGAAYEPDIQSTPGSFGHLIIYLPSAHTGGDVVVQHNGKRVTWRTSDTTQSFACWYSDVIQVEHSPVHSGFRCVLIYNLAISPSSTLPSAGVLDSRKEPLRNALQRWLRYLDSSDPTKAPSHLYHPLDHEYTTVATMSQTNLKGKDFTRTQVLRSFAHEFEFEIFLAHLEKLESGFVCREPARYPDTDSSSSASHHDLDDVDETIHTVKSLCSLDGTFITSNFEFDPTFCVVRDPFKDVKIAKEDYNYEYGQDTASLTHWYRRSALVIVPHRKLGTFFAQCTSGSSSDDDYTASSTDSNHACLSNDDPKYESALNYLGRIRSTPSAQMSMLDAMCTLYVSQPCKKLHRADLLRTALQYSHYPLFQTVGVRHQSRLHTCFFDWAKEWLNMLSDADRAEKYQVWIPFVLQGFPSMADRLDTTRKMSDPLGDASTSDTALSSTPWAQDVIRRCIKSFPDTNKTPTVSDSERLLSALLGLNDPWEDTSALLTSVFERFPQADATAFLLDILSRLKAQAQVFHPLMYNNIELYRGLALRVFHSKRKLSQIIHAEPTAKVAVPKLACVANTRDLNIPTTPAESGLVVTAKTLVQFACDLSDTSTDANNMLQQFLQEITAQCATFSLEGMKNLWIPFLYQLIQALGSQPTILDTPAVQQLAGQLVKHLADKTLGPYPQAGVNFPCFRVSCSCRDCGELNQFLRNPSQRVGRFKMVQHRRQHLQAQLGKDGIACTQDTYTGGSPYTLAVTKSCSLQDEVSKWNRRQNELYVHITQNIRPEHLESLLGPVEATRIQSLAKPTEG
ncbi:hypothetical protein PCANC_12951 [Puccinia coronata f. sp. avenae]|uniref:Uncharacterized protein n=1 Tax=Puccinia coronata f. sp. avenae TaxID=200324 RepID=A0A2N5SD08_9BASI|nr:hypothetical protein PCASD_19267 [Puccinia coronata f. sp. avenae]PLW14541.1 hypothetical protein PCANC_12951 [Puccinia coronata f. sp. avenae]